MTSVFDFDINDRLARIRHAKDAAGLFEVSYTYDAAGGRRYTGDMLAADHSELYIYDARGRLQPIRERVSPRQGPDRSEDGGGASRRSILRAITFPE
ncbi:MAG: hypothetical protein ACPMAQ_15305 [Phycisphaerae bacterium]